MSRALYAQMIGRGTRPLPNTVDGLTHDEQRLQSIADSLKPNCLVLDFAGNSGRHKLVSAADVLGGNYSVSVVEEANRMAKQEQTPVDTLSLLEKAEQSVLARMREEKEKRMRKGVHAKVAYRKRSLDPFDVLDIEPALEDNEWKADPLSHKQLMYLERQDIDTAAMTPAELRKVYNQLVNRRIRNLATPKQVRLLKKYGYNTKDMSFDAASSLITRLANNNWRKV